MAFITIAGEQLIAAKQGAGQVLHITNFVLANIAGLGTEPVNRIETMPASSNVVDIRAVSYQGYVNNNQVVYSLAMDSTIGDYDFNWVGLQADTGDIVAVAYIPTQHKRKTVAAVPGNNLTRNFLLEFTGIAATTAINVPANTWQIDFTTRLLQIDERERLANFDIYGNIGFFGNGFSAVAQDATHYTINAGVCYVGGIRCQLNANAVVNVNALPKSIWIDASLQGDINGVTAVFSFSASAVNLSNYTDNNGFQHYVAKIADISAGGLVSDARMATNLVVDHEAKPNPHPQYKMATVIDVPVGTILPMIAVQTGFLVCPPSPTPLKQNQYPALYQVCGTKYGPVGVDGSGNATFIMPYLTTDNTLVQANSVANKNVGSNTDGSVINHVHTLGNANSYNASTSTGGGGVAAVYPGPSANSGNPTTGTAQNLAAGARVLFCVKF